MESCARVRRRRQAEIRNPEEAAVRHDCGRAGRLRFMLREFAPAKINLFLHAGEKRPDGYHELESLVVFAEVGDELTFTNSDKLSLEVTGPIARELTSGDNNLVLRAANVFAQFA